MQINLFELLVLGLLYQCMRQCLTDYYTSVIRYCLIHIKFRMRNNTSNISYIQSHIGAFTLYMLGTSQFAHLGFENCLSMGTFR